ncbi:M56 family metallopeptidase [Kitasatospora sp. NPDC048365]|uniref:M56 family metallopeptidase n=1 Tax=Kitasatospora sp. NPDC048365 TaxID=3364050 RepID=UPI003717607D
MSGTEALVGFALVVGFAAPGLLRRAHWPQRAPGVAVLVWLGLMLSFVTSLALAAHHLVEPEKHRHAGLPSLLHACGLTHLTDLGLSTAALAPALVAAWPLGRVAAVLVRAGRERRRHAAVLDLVARPAAGLPALLLDHQVPAVYCLPGRRRRIVLTRGALEQLPPAQLHAVLAHEQAHLTGRHHLLKAAAQGFAEAFPGLPLGTAGREQTATLLEMAADDRAVRHHARRDLAAALGTVAAGLAPGAGLGAAGSPVVARVRRLLSPARAPHPLARCATGALALAVPLLPFLLTCGPAAN